MKNKPFFRLDKNRSVAMDLPASLAEFYRNYEGIGLESSPDHPVRLSRLDEIQIVQWNDLYLVGRDPISGWEEFRGYRIGNSCFFDELILVIQAPCCEPGSILALGVDIAGPGGSGPYALECSLVLASNYSDWISNLKLCHGHDYGLVPGELKKPDLRVKHYERLKALNPHIQW